MAELDRQKELAGGQERNRLHRSMRNGAFLSAIPCRLNGTELPQKEFRDDICLRYGIVPQDIPVNSDGCGKRFLIYHALSCPEGGLVMSRHDDASKEGGDI